MDSNHRSCEATDLQSAPFGHSGTPPDRWSWRTESNHQPADYKSAALPIELRQHTYLFISNLIYGGHNRARTYDPLLVRQVLSQLSYAPIKLCCLYCEKYNSTSQNFSQTF